MELQPTLTHPGAVLPAGPQLCCEQPCGLQDSQELKLRAASARCQRSGMDAPLSLMESDAPLGICCGFHGRFSLYTGMRVCLRNGLQFGSAAWPNRSCRN